MKNILLQGSSFSGIHYGIPNEVIEYFMFHQLPKIDYMISISKREI